MLNGIFSFTIVMSAFGIVGMHRERDRRFFAQQQGKNRRDDEQRGESGEQESADHGAAERGLHLGPLFQG